MQSSLDSIAPAVVEQAADLRMVAFMLARSVRALRSERIERGADLLLATQKLVERLPHSTEKARALTLVETLAGIGFERELLAHHERQQIA